MNGVYKRLADVLTRGMWSRRETFSLSGDSDWCAVKRADDASSFECYYRGTSIGTVSWNMIGDYNLLNALAAAAAAHAIGVDFTSILNGLSSFRGVAKRMETLVSSDAITVVRDFAHHPTAIAGALTALRQRFNSDRLITMLEVGSRTMQRHVDVSHLGQALSAADRVLVLRSSEVQWPLESLESHLGERLMLVDSAECCVQWLMQHRQHGDRVILLSNKHFNGLAERLQQQLNTTKEVG